MAATSQAARGRAPLGPPTALPSAQSRRGWPFARGTVRSRRGARTSTKCRRTAVTITSSRRARPFAASRRTAPSRSRLTRDACAREMKLAHARTHAVRHARRMSMHAAPVRSPYTLCTALVQGLGARGQRRPDLADEPHQGRQVVPTGRTVDGGARLPSVLVSGVGALVPLLQPGRFCVHHGERLDWRLGPPQSGRRILLRSPHQVSAPAF